MSILGISCIIVLGIILFIVVMTLLIIYISNYPNKMYFRKLKYNDLKFMRGDSKTK